MFDFFKNKQDTNYITVYTADKIASYILGYCSNLEKSISNSQLQKLLYFCWIEYYRNTKTFLFSEHFTARKLGPVVLDIYYKYCMFGAFPIYEDLISLPENVNKDIIDNCLNTYIDWNFWDLIAKSQQRGGAWKAVFKDGKDIEIPKRLIIDLECNKSKIKSFLYSIFKSIKK